MHHRRRLPERYVRRHPGVCTASDQCHVAGTCNPATGQCSTPTTVADGAACNDGNACTTGDTGTSGGSSRTPVSVAGGDQCHTAGTCNPSTGTCSNSARPDGTACNDNDPCTINDACTNGVCAGTLSPEACLDHFKCYTTKNVSPKTIPHTVTLQDQFE